MVKLIVGAYERDHSSIYVSQTIGGTTISGSAFETEVECQYGDIVALERAGAIDVVSYSDAGRISTFAPTPFASALTHPTDYVDLSDAAWTIARDTLQNQPERIRDVQRILRGICDAPDTPGPINETARAADLLLDQIERYISTGDPADDALARAAAAAMRALATTILRRSVEYGPIAIELAEAVMQLFEG